MISTKAAARALALNKTGFTKSMMPVTRRGQASAAVATACQTNQFRLLSSVSTTNYGSFCSPRKAPTTTFHAIQIRNFASFAVTASESLGKWDASALKKIEAELKAVDVNHDGR
jgi:hypothetical protein